ncbi:MAG TPA: putative peptidoglycan glycosyltransferase FtsW [Solirubrobacteraceae bacterium]|jgi:cell division protein FtsW
MASVAATPGRVERTPESTVRTPRRLPIEYSALLTATLCLLAGGAVMVYSASAPAALNGGSAGGASSLIRFVVYGAVGLVLLRVAARADLESIRRLTGSLLGVAFVLLIAVRIPGLGHGTLGAQRWVGAGPAQFEPSELMKLALVLYAAHVLTHGRPGGRARRTALKRLGIVGTAALLLVGSQPDIGTAAVIAFALFAILLAGGVSARVLTIGAIVAIGAVILFAIAVPYAGARLTSFIDPQAHATTTGYQESQSQIAIGSGGFFGRGPGAGLQKDYYLPEAQTDFILAVIGEELGFVGIAVLLALYGLIAYAGLRAAHRAKGSYAMLVAVGVTSLVVLQAMLNVFAVLGIAPVTGVPLPFVSYGASNLLVMLTSMGLLLNVAGGGAAHLRSVRGTTRRKAKRSEDERSAEDRDRSRRDRWARRSGVGDRGRAAGAGG